MNKEFGLSEKTDKDVMLSENDRGIRISHTDVKSSPSSISWHGTGDFIESYTVDYTVDPDARIIGFLVFYSEKDIYTLTKQGYRDESNPNLLLMDLTKEEILALANENRAKFVDDLREPSAFTKDQKDIYNAKSFGEGVYYVYGATVGERGILDLSTAHKMIITAPVPKPATERIGDGIGTLMPAGGNTSPTDPNSAVFYKSIRVAAGGGTPRIALLSSSRETLGVVSEHFYFKDPEFGSFEDNFKALGFEPVYIPLCIDTYDVIGGEYRNDVADSAYWAGVVKTCEAVFLQGGDQSKHAKSLLRGNGEDTLILSAMRYVYDRGGVIAGTSAGMHVMSDTVIGYGNPDVVLATNETERVTIKEIPVFEDIPLKVADNNFMHPGIALLPLDILTDTHFDDRGRFGRLIVALRDTGARIGLGADEGTAFPIRKMIGEVIGNHGVFIIDTANATYSASGGDVHFKVTNLRVHYLTRGDQYNIESNTVFVAAHKTEIVEDSQYEFSNAVDPFGGDYGLTKSIQAFIASDAISKTIVSSTGFDLTFKKEDDYSAYISEEQYIDADLLGYNQMTVVNLAISVAKNLKK